MSYFAEAIRNNGDERPITRTAGEYLLVAAMIGDAVHMATRPLVRGKADLVRDDAFAWLMYDGEPRPWTAAWCLDLMGLELPAVRRAIRVARDEGVQLSMGQLQHGSRA